MRAPSHRVANALTPLGQRVKAIDLLRFLNDAALRQQGRTPLHRGESRQDVAPRIFFADQGGTSRRVAGKFVQKCTLRNIRLFFKHLYRGSTEFSTLSSSPSALHHSTGPAVRADAGPDD